MGRYILRRVLYAIPIAFGVSVVCFSLVYLAPGDPLQTVLPPDATAETIAIVKKAYGFDKPLPTQFLIWLGRVVTGDFGMSIATRRPVILEVTGALANTGLLAMFAVPIAFSIGYTMGAVAGSFPGRWIDRVVTGAAVLGVSLPNYWVGIVLVIVFAVELMALPAAGMGPSGVERLSYFALGRRTIPGSAGHHPVDDSGRHSLSHHPRCDRRGSQPGFRSNPARQGPLGMGGDAPCDEEFAAADHGGDGVAVRLSDRRLDPG
jgi:peptide/nickel transport system permease protein